MANRKRNNLLVLALVLLAVLIMLIGVAVFIEPAPDPSLSTTPSEDTTVPSSQATQPPTNPPTQPPVVKESTFTLSATGDILMHMPVINYYSSGSSYNFDGAFSYLKEYAAKADYAIANLETTLAGLDNGYKYSGYPNFNCPDAIVDGLKNAGFDMLLTANNHSYDTRTVGLTRTQEVIADRALGYLGTQVDADALDYQLVEQNGGIDFSRPFALAYSGLDDSMLQKYIADSASLYEGKADTLPVHTIGSTIGTHAGPGAIAVAFFSNN